MADSTLNDFVSSGTAAEMAGFTPSPPTPASGNDPGYTFFNTDDGILYSWDGANWVSGGGGSGSVTNTGTLTDHQVILGNAGVDITALGSLGSSGDVLTSQGAAADPVWAAPSGGGGLVLVESHAASVSASLPFILIDSTYDDYEFVFNNIVPSANTILYVDFSTNGGSTWVSSAIYDFCATYNYPPNSSGTMLGAAAATQFSMRESATTLSANGSYNITLRLMNPNSGKNKAMFGTIVIDDNSVGSLRLDWSGRFISATVVNGVRLIPAAGTLTTGVGYCYGRAK